MLQIVQNFRSGELKMEEVPPPALLPGGLRIRTAASIISAGTERMLIDLARRSLTGKARARPDLVRQVVQKARREGLLNTVQTVRSRLESPQALGYSAAGFVEAIGPGVTGFNVGDRVALAGAGYANHAEVNFVPVNLVAHIPEGVTFEEAAYTTISSIALQGVRIASPELGENVVVIGLGLLGLITVQLLQASGCRVIGMDLDASRVAFARQIGLEVGIDLAADEPVAANLRFTNGRGADCVLITAATKSNRPIELAGELCRRRARVVIVGTVGMNVPRDAYYKKELSLRVSMSYGPGRYDPRYEEGGVDYPYEFVRWTEQRNMEAALDLMTRRRLDLQALTTHRYPFNKALDAYELIRSRAFCTGILLEYDVERQQPASVVLKPAGKLASTGSIGVGVVGAGNYASLHLIPYLAKNKAVHLTTLVTARGMSARQKAEHFGFAKAASDLQELIDEGSSSAVVIATRHAQHAELAIQAMEAGLNVFVEKPMVVDEAQLDSLAKAYQRTSNIRSTALMVGLNRRFAPMMTSIKSFLAGVGPYQMSYRVNSGPIPTTSWLHEDQHGAGMLVSEMVHFFDVMLYLTAVRPLTVFARSITSKRTDLASRDSLAVTVTFDDGSVGVLVYNTLGDRAAPKERLEVFGGGRVALLDDFRRLERFTEGRRQVTRSLNQDKGQAHMVPAVVDAFRSGTSPIPFDELVAGMEIVFAAQRSLASGEPERVGRSYRRVEVVSDRKLMETGVDGSSN